MKPPKWKDIHELLIEHFIGLPDICKSVTEPYYTALLAQAESHFGDKVATFIRLHIDTDTVGYHLNESLDVMKRNWNHYSRQVYT